MADGMAYGANMFLPEVVEKVYMLSTVLRAIDEHPVLSGNLALHGGTAPTSPFW